MTEINERLVIVSLRSREQLMELGTKKIKADDFIFHRDKLEFILTYYKQYQKPPTLQVLTTQFADFEPPNPDEASFTYYLDQLKKDALQSQVARYLENELVGLLKTDPGEAIRSMSQFSTNMISSVETDVSHTDRDAVKRLQWYEEKRLFRNKGMITGIPTGFRYFNDKREGFNYGNLVVLVGHTWVGKSWMLLYTAIRAYLAGERVLLFSCEMTKDEEEIRFDTLMAAAKKVSLPFNALKSGGGNLGDTYEAYLKELSATDNWITADSSDVENMTMDDITLLVDKFKPTVVAIDGMEFLRDPKSKNRAGWEEAKSVVQDAKRLATSKKLLVIGTAQARRGKDDHMPKLNDIAYSADIVRAADYVLAFSKVEEEDGVSNKMRACTVQKERNGEGHTKRIKLHFDPANGQIGELAEVDEAKRGLA